MSHGHERNEKVCLNCGANLYGRYCHACGQENVEPKESLGQLIRHFFEDITHFDGKFFSTIKVLVTKPGFLPQEYLSGRRARYLHPVRMYMFISFIFFFVLYTFSRDIAYTTAPAQKTKSGKHDKINIKLDTVAAQPIHIVSDTGGFFIKDSANDPANLAQYNAHQDSLPSDKKDGRLSRYMKQKVFAISDATSNAKTNKEFINRTIEKFFHSLPQMFFVVLPLFALILNLLYIRRRKGYNYVAHAIFTVYFYCFVFLSEIIIQFTKLIPYARYVIRPVFSIGILFYLYKAMRNFYKQGRGKTILKFFILNLVLGITLTILIVVYMFIAAVSVV